MSVPHKLRRASALVPAVMLGVTLAACGSGSQTQSTSPNSAGPTSVQGLQAAAKKEGSLTLYTTIAGDDVQKVVGAFNKSYPGVHVNALRLSAEKLPPRILTEQRGRKFNADVVTGDSPQISQLIAAGALQQFEAPDQTPLPAGLKLPAGFRTVAYALTTVIAYNPTVLKQDGLSVPTTWEDLTKPEWRGKFSIDPSAVNWFDSLVSSMGHEKAHQLLQRLAANGPRLVSGHTEALTQVQSGEPVATIAAYGYKAASLKEKSPGSLDFSNPTPLPTSLNLVDVVKNAPHPNAAKLFVDWMVSTAGQQAIADFTGQTSIRSDIQNDPSVWDPKKWPPAWGDPSLPTDTYNSYVQELKTTLGAP